MQRFFLSFFLAFLSFLSPLKAGFDCDIFQRVDPATFRITQREAVWHVADNNAPAMDFVCLVSAAENELISNAIDWINGYVRQQTNQVITVRPERAKLAPMYVGFGEEAGKTLAGMTKDFPLNVDPGPQGFILKQIVIDGNKAMSCWSPTALGCRYGLIEFLRSLKTKGNTLVSDIEYVVDAPNFPVRIHYVNFAEHLQNIYSPNVLFESKINRWSLNDWERYIDMISAYRFNIFEFWLVPSLLGRVDEERCDKFVQTINHVVSYAKRRGISVHPLVTVNTISGKGDWFFACPNDPNEKKQIVDAWDFWTKSIQENSSWCIFPGDPGGCTRNGCTKETYIDLALELSTLIRKNNPTASVEVGTWGEPFSGWGIPLWQADRELAERSMEYLLKKLPEFPQGTFTSINTGFNPDSDATSQEGQHAGWGGGDGRPFARRAAASVPVLTWDYSVTEGEAGVFPHCRVRRMIEKRNNEWELGCYSGGICYTMSPQIQSLSAFASAETWWNPNQKAEAIMGNYGRWTFGEGKEIIGHLLEEFEVIQDWGYYPPFPYSAVRLAEKMSDLLMEIKKLDVQQSPRLPLAMEYVRYVKSLEYFATLFNDLANISLQVDELNDVFCKTSLGEEVKEKVSLAVVQDFLETKKDFIGWSDLEAAAQKLAKWDIRRLKKRYVDSIYGIYDHIEKQPESRIEVAMSLLFDRFQTSFAEPLVQSIQENQPAP